MVPACVAGVSALHVHHPPGPELTQLPHQVGTSHGASKGWVRACVRSRAAWGLYFRLLLPRVPFAQPHLLEALRHTHIQEQFHLPPQQQSLKSSLLLEGIIWQQAQGPGLNPYTDLVCRGLSVVRD